MYLHWVAICRYCCESHNIWEVDGRLVIVLWLHKLPGFQLFRHHPSHIASFTIANQCSLLSMWTYSCYQLITENVCKLLYACNNKYLCLGSYTVCWTKAHVSALNYFMATEWLVIEPICSRLLILCPPFSTIPHNIFYTNTRLHCLGIGAAGCG